MLYTSSIHCRAWCMLCACHIASPCQCCQNLADWENAWHGVYMLFLCLQCCSSWVNPESLNTDNGHNNYYVCHACWVPAGCSASCCCCLSRSVTVSSTQIRQVKLCYTFAALLLHMASKPWSSAHERHRVSHCMMCTWNEVQEYQGQACTSICQDQNEQSIDSAGCLVVRSYPDSSTYSRLGSKVVLVSIACITVLRTTCFTISNQQWTTQEQQHH